MAIRPVFVNISKSYRFLALQLLNTLVLLVLVNVGLAGLFRLRDPMTADATAASARSAAPTTPGSIFKSDGSPGDNGRRSPYQLTWFDFGAYEGIEPAYAGDVLDDFYALSKIGFIYQPWVQFSEPPFKGRRVNVDLDPLGFPLRHTDNGSNPDGLPVVKIFALGGSTTFGYNVSDEHTWPSFLSKILNEKARAEGLGVHVEVANYGRGFFNPSQEAVLTMDLLKHGHRPNLFVFMDGVNHGVGVNYADIPFFTDRISSHVRNLQVPSTTIFEHLEWLPMSRVAQFLKRVLLKTETEQPQDPLPVDVLVNYNFNYFSQNARVARAVSDLYSTKTLFFLQPNAVYNYPLELYRQPVPDTFVQDRAVARGSYTRLLAEPGRVYLGDLFERWGRGRKAIVDDVHYSPGFNQFLAQQVAEHIVLNTLQPQQLIDESEATAPPRIGRR